jgi:hypothetical protein
MPKLIKVLATTGKPDVRLTAFSQSFDSFYINGSQKASKTLLYTPKTTT